MAGEVAVVAAQERLRGATLEALVEEGGAGVAVIVGVVATFGQPGAAIRIVVGVTNTIRVSLRREAVRRFRAGSRRTLQKRRSSPSFVRIGSFNERAVPG